jgi:hypothetical protein
MITTARENRIKEVYRSLVPPPQQSLHHSQIDLDSLSALQKIFVPIFKEMKETETELSEEEFVQAGTRLLKYISPSEKAVLTRKNSKAESSK